MTRVIRKTGLLFALISIFYINICAQRFNTIDAVTSASKTFKVVGGKAYATSAQITWWEYYNNATQELLKWGLSAQSLTNQKNLKPFTASNNVTTTITGLTADTKYYGQFYRPYQGINYVVNFSFTTSPGTAINSSDSPKIQSVINPEAAITDLYSIAGKLIFSSRTMQVALNGNADRSAIPENILSVVPEGSYILILKDIKNGSILTTSRFVLVR